LVVPYSLYGGGGEEERREVYRESKQSDELGGRLARPRKEVTHNTFTPFASSGIVHSSLQERQQVEAPSQHERCMVPLSEHFA
jgi:hypothetical protein